jgi:hypothetical protein
MINNFSLSIKNPCPANWNEMTPNMQGKFCGQCSLTVVDFTKMNEAEIKEYFLCHHGQKTCGRFKTSQLGNPSKVNDRLRQSYIKITVISILALLTFLSGCRKPASKTPPHIMGDVDYETMGEPVFKMEQVDTIKTVPPIETPLK